MRKRRSLKTVAQSTTLSLEKDEGNRPSTNLEGLSSLGPVFKNVDNRILSLELVKNKMTEAVMFGPDGNNIAKPMFLRQIGSDGSYNLVGSFADLAYPRNVTY